MKRIYLDNAATTPLNERVALAMQKFEKKYWGNPNSLHREGQQARAEIDFARAKIAKFINAKPQEIVFTSGATEANNHAIRGTVENTIYISKIKKPHVITTRLEHQSVYNVVKKLEGRGVIEATFIRLNSDGIIDPKDIFKAIKKNTVLISVIFVSNEIGTILPIREIGKKISQIMDHRSSIVFHTDAVAAERYQNLNVEKLNCDLLTLSAHKICGPKGIGALYVKQGLKLQNLLIGGSQEYGKRAGTQNTPAIIGFAKAMEELGSLEKRQQEALKIIKLRDKLLNFISSISDCTINGPVGDERSPDNISFTLYDIDQDALMTALDLSGIAASTGSACVSGSTEPSHVIEALGKIVERNAATVRLTLGKQNTEKEINQVIKILPSIIAKLKRIA